MKSGEMTVQKSITRTDVAQWYGITERGLRYRMKNADVHIINRILTKCDIMLIIKNLGDPQFMPIKLAEIYCAD